MPAWLEMAVTIFGSVMASSGLWAFIVKVQEKKDIKSRMLLGLGHDKIIYLCKCYLSGESCRKSCVLSFLADCKRKLVIGNDYLSGLLIRICKYRKNGCG